MESFANTYNTAFVESLRSQRNTALDSVAQMTGLIAAKDAEIADLKLIIEKLQGQVPKDVGPGNAHPAQPEASGKTVKARGNAAQV